MLMVTGAEASAGAKVAVASTRRRRVLYLANAAHIGGGNRVLLQLWSKLLPCGIDPVVVLPTGGPMEEECARLGLSCHIVSYFQPGWSAPLASWRALRAWRLLLRRIRPELIHANDPVTARTIGWAARLERIPLICHVHFPPSRQALAWLFRFLPKPEAFVFCSQALLAEVGASLRQLAPRSRQLAIQNCVSVDDFDPTPLSPDGVDRVGIVANLLPIKGHLDFLSMAAELTARGIEAEYLIVGDDVHRTGYRNELENRAEVLGLKTRVRFLGHCRNVPDILRQLDVVVCASHIEPFGMCVLEALACGRPVVATRVGGIPEIVEDRRNGFLVPPGAPSQLADAAERLLRNRDLRLEMGRVGRERAARHFSQEAYVVRVLTLYQRTLGTSLAG